MLRSVHVGAIKGREEFAKTWSRSGFNSSVRSFLGIGYLSAGVPV